MLKAKITNHKIIHRGYVELDQYDLAVPSLKHECRSVSMNQREILSVADSVLVLLYAPKLDVVVLCQQFRPGVFLHGEADDPFLYECVAGTIEKNSSPVETAIKETYEETGLEISQLKLIAKVYKSPGLMTEKTYLYYAEVAGAPEPGIHGVGDEQIQTHLVSPKQLDEMVDEMKIMDAASLLAIHWFKGS